MSIQYDQLGRNVCAIRNQRELTQKAMAEQLTCSPEHLCHIENGDRHMQLDMIEHFCEVMGVSYEDVLQHATSVPIAADAREEGDEPWWQAEFEGILAGCSDRKIREILDICRKIVRISRS